LGGPIAAGFFAAWEENKNLRMGNGRGGPTSDPGSIKWLFG
jgi:hypothetical protein